MTDARPRLIVVCGPTATGKTALALEIAGRLGGEIINADSMQVYRHMDIGTAKPPPAERARVPFHLLDVADPDDTFSTGRFRELAGGAVAAIAARGRVPIVAGGTGLYIKALTKGLWEGPPANWELRRGYKELEAATPGSLHRRLQEVDPPRAAQVHPADYVRLERALEVFDLTGKPLSRWQAEHGFADAPYRLVKIGLTLPRDAQAVAIDERVDEMMANGWLREVRQLRALGYGPDLPSQAAIGYRELHAHLDGRLTLREAVERTKASTRQFAKRQRTWFGADRDIRWFDADRDRAAAVAAADEFIHVS
ncbi:MAG: tRNA (adenosine(37)-N6)-dimethylallyltransferase MiaA [Myxococcales bacterium]|nr:tRNA (adenosine(37)-N6)-dimethylallyltransferase MiaA [Myxococcales bacterium]